MQVRSTQPKGLLTLRRRQAIVGEDEAMARVHMYRTCGERLQEARLIMNVPQAVLAQRLGLSQPYVSCMEHSQAYMDTASADRVAGLLNELAQERGKEAQYRGEWLLELWPQVQPQEERDGGVRSA